MVRIIRLPATHQTSRFDEPIYQKRLVRRILQTENESALKFNFTNPTLYSCINGDVQNKWGVPK